MAAQPRIRKNIDSLTPAELADYEHAFTKLKEISDADPDSIDGLQYFTDLHNTMLGPCEHANDTFLPWHRAHLFLFEEALRRSRSEEHTSELQSRQYLVCRLLLEKK